MDLPTRIVDSPWIPFVDKMFSCFRRLSWFTFPLYLSGINAWKSGSADFTGACSSITSQLDLGNATVYFAQLAKAGSNITFPDNDPTCGRSSQVIQQDICRIALSVPTSNRSEISMEVWLPRNWTGRFLSAGNGGLAGCIQYEDVAYATSLGFAAAGANGGHNGTDDSAFLNNPDTLADFSYRSIHTGIVVGKKVTQTFYGKPHTKAYYLGCSTGGRQGLKLAQDFPDDVDGIVAGAPAAAFNGLVFWSGYFFHYTGLPDSPSFLSADLWRTVHQDILKQCDGLDGVADGILEDPSLCQYRPEALICAPGNTTNCLTGEQANTVRKVYSPLYGLDGNLIYPSAVPGSEGTSLYYGGAPFILTIDWFKYVVYNDPTWDPNTLSLADYAKSLAVDTTSVETWKGDLSAFSARNGKVLTYHGGADSVISPYNSERYYNFVSRTMNRTSSSLDEFYRLFRISGMDHCAGGVGAWGIGQVSSGASTLEPEGNVLTAMVRWVENGVPPESILGTKYVNDTQSLGVQRSRRHCKYPARNVYDGHGDVSKPSSWSCV